MRLKLVLRKLGGRLLRAVPGLARMPSTHLMVLGVDRKEPCWVLNRSCQPLPPEGKPAQKFPGLTGPTLGWMTSHTPWESRGSGLPGSHGGTASCPRLGSAGSQVVWILPPHPHPRLHTPKSPGSQGGHWQSWSLVPLAFPEHLEARFPQENRRQPSNLPTAPRSQFCLGLAGPAPLHCALRLHSGLQSQGFGYGLLFLQLGWGGAAAGRRLGH